MHVAPHSVERGLLGYFIVEPPDAYLLSTVGADWFGDTDDLALFEWISERYKKQEPIDLILIAREQPKLLPRAVEAIAIYNDSGLGSEAIRMHYVNCLRQDWAEKEIKRIASNGEPLEESKERMKWLFSQSDVSVSRPWVTPGDIVERLLQDISERRGRGPLLPTGYAHLDELTDGLHAGELWTVGAYTSVGKTVCLTSFAHRLLSKGHKVLYFTSEMPNLEYIKHRLLPVVTGVHAEAIRKNNITEIEWKQIQDGSKILEELPLYVVDHSTPSLADVELSLRGTKPTVAFIDHLHRCDLPKAETKNEALNEFMRGLKTLARDFGIPIVAAAQLNRGSQSMEQPGLMHLRDSGSLEMESDCVLLLHRDREKDMLTGKSEYGSTIHVNLAKNRHGACGMFDLKLSVAEMLLIEV